MNKGSGGRPPLLAVVRIRGTVNVRYDHAYTLDLLRLKKPFRCVLVPATPSYVGMLKKVRKYITWGEIDFDTLVHLLRKRGRVTGDRPLTDEFVREKLGFESIEDLARALLEGRLQYKDLEERGVKPYFRLHPPRKGFKKSVKKFWGAGGEAGYRGPAINELLKRMI